ncbi:MAG: AAA family ATPase [Gemmobacter sp.]
MSRRVQIVPAAVGAFSVDEALAELNARRRARGKCPITYTLKASCKKRLEARLSRTLAVYPTFRDLPKDKGDPIRRLARSGAAVAGPETLHAVDEMTSALHAEAPWCREVSTFIMLYLRASIAAGTPGLLLPPILLVGDPGCGKSRYALRLAEIGGVPSRRIDVGSGSAGFRISGVERGWSSTAPGVPVETVLATRTANALFVVDEVDKAGTAHGTSGGATCVTTSLLEMLEPATAARFECPAYRLPFDLSHLVWVLTANRLDTVPAPIRDRCRVFHIPNPAPADLVAVFDRQTSDIDDRELVRDARTKLTSGLASGGVSLRQLRAFIDAVRAFSTKPEFH